VPSISYRQMRPFIYIKVFWVKVENCDPKNVEIVSWTIYKKNVDVLRRVKEERILRHKIK
jgi:hypothetical protein